MNIRTLINILILSTKKKLKEVSEKFIPFKNLIVTINNINF